MKYTIIFLFTMLNASLIYCCNFKQQSLSRGEGVKGKVMLLKGNVMPSPDAPKGDGGKAVERTVRIYQITSLNQVKGQSPLFTEISTQLVAKVKTDKAGNFLCKLPPGQYSIFTEEANGKLFANLFDGSGAITSFVVKPKEITTYNITINYDAFY